MSITTTATGMLRLCSAQYGSDMHEISYHPVVSHSTLRNACSEFMIICRTRSITALSRTCERREGWANVKTHSKQALHASASQLPPFECACCNGWVCQ